MKTEQIKRSIQINAPKENVWDILVNDQFTRIWYAEFGEGSHADTDWKKGSKAVFADNKGSGLVGKVIVNKPYEMLSVEYEGVVAEGREDYESDHARNVKGGRETYKLTEKDGGAHLYVECDTDVDYFEMMLVAWDKALLKIKSLSESK